MRDARQPAPKEHGAGGNQRAAAASPNTDDPLDRVSRQVWRVTVQVTEFKLEGDSDIHLVMFGGDSYGIAEMPAAQCLPKTTRDCKAIIGARKAFTARCGEPTKSWKTLGATVAISGVGFFDIPHTQMPHALNFAELHPVTAIRLVSGCGAQTRLRTKA